MFRPIGQATGIGFGSGNEDRFYLGSSIGGEEKNSSSFPYGNYYGYGYGSGEGYNGNTLNYLGLYCDTPFLIRHS